MPLKTSSNAFERKEKEKEKEIPEGTDEAVVWREI